MELTLLLASFYLLILDIDQLILDELKKTGKDLHEETKTNFLTTLLFWYCRHAEGRTVFTVL